MKSTPTHAMIAAACGVNVSTVSRALNDNPVIPEATRRRIKAAAEEMGWKVNPLVSAYMAHLRSSRDVQYFANLAYVIPFPHVRRLDHLPGYHLEHFTGCAQQAQSLGYGLEPIWYSEWEGSGKRLTSLLRNRGIPGVILYGMSVLRENYQDFDWSQFSIAAWGGMASPDYRLHHSSPHLHYDMTLALGKVRDYGYRKIALMLFEQQDELSGHVLYASYLYEKAFDQTGVNYEYLRLAENSTVKTRKKLAQDWLGKHEVDLVIGEQIIWELCNEMNLGVPDKVGFVSMCYNAGWPDIGGVDQQAGVIGSNTVDLVVDQLVHNERGLPANPKMLYSGGIWVDGPSVPNRQQPEGAVLAAV